MQMPGVHPDGHGAIGRIVHSQVAAALLEHHLRVEFPHTQQGHTVRLHLEGSQRTLQAGELTLLIGECIAVPVLLQPPLRHKLHRIRIGILKPLNALDGDDHILFHRNLHWSFISPGPPVHGSQGGRYYTLERRFCKGERLSYLFYAILSQMTRGIFHIKSLILYLTTRGHRL